MTSRRGDDDEARDLLILLYSRLESLY